MMPSFVTTPSGIRICVTHPPVSKRAAVILAPGFFASKDTRTFRAIADDLRGDTDVIAMDFRGHGRSSGLYTFSARETEDLKAVVDYARGSYKKVGVLGFSYGGTVAILEAAAHRDVDSVVTVGSPMAADEIEFRWWTPEAMRLGLLKFEWGNGVRPGNPFLPKTRAIDVVASLSPIPLFLIHGTGDPTVHHRHAEKLYEAARDPKQLRLYEKGSHAEEVYRRYRDSFVRSVREWFARTLA